MSKFSFQYLKQKKIFVLGDSFLASGYLTYLGPYDQLHRAHMKSTWQKIVSKFLFEIVKLPFTLKAIS